MKGKYTRGLAVVFLIASFISCSKSNDNRSARLILLQQTWASRIIRYYLPNGDTTQYWSLYPSNSTFTFGTDLNYYQSNTATKIPYTLLPDDSTLIFTRNNLLLPETVYDTNYITSLTSNTLIFHGFENQTGMISRDTMRR